MSSPRWGEQMHAARRAEAADLLQALNTGHGGSLATVHANNAEAALSRPTSCAMQASDDLPWAVICRNIVDGIEAVVREEFEAAVAELFDGGPPIEASSVEALEQWGFDLEDEGGGIEER